MRHPCLKSISLLPAILVLSGCNWVQLTSDGRGVALSTQAQIANCTRIGTTVATTSSKVTFVPRGGEKMQDELVMLARNEAGLMGGTNIVPASTIEDGRQQFTVYRCP